MPNRIAKQIYTTIERATRVLLIPHKNPDGDALGSVTALMHMLRSMNKDHEVFCSTLYPEKLAYLPGVEKLKNDDVVWEDESFDLIIVVDTGDLKHAGVDAHLSKRKRRPTVINIDHHATNEQFGDINLVIPTASSTCEIIYTFLKINQVSIDKHMATCLLTGLVTDTGNFTNAATTVLSLQIASELMNKGGDMRLIKDLMFKDKSVNVLKLWGTVLSRLAKHDDHQIVYTYVTQADLKKHNIDEGEVEGIANFMNALSEGKAALVLKELPGGKVKGSFRTTRNDTDVSAIAQNLGGGGHKKAAGFTVDGPIDIALKNVWSTLDKDKKA